MYKLNMKNDVGVTMDPTDEFRMYVFRNIETHSRDKFTQHCDKTMVGFMQQINDKK